MMYGFFSTVIFFVMLPFWLIAGIFKPKLLHGFKQKLGFFDAPKLKDTIVFYGVSVGEVIALENLIKKTKETFNNKIVICTGTKTGQEIANKKLGDIADFITYFPFDFPFCIGHFLNKVNPKIVIVAETELWPNFARLVKNRGIPLMIINGRISDRTYKSYKKLSFFFKPILRNYDKILTQSEQDNKKLISIGANPETTIVMGNLKFDITKKDCDFNLGLGRIIIAGSTHSGEDELILPVFEKLKKDFSDIKLLIAPRHPERLDAVKKLVNATDLSWGLRTQNDSFDSKDIILLDTMGELGKAYALCYIAIMGGSFNKTGGHNPLEAVVYEKPVISGTCVHNFKDIYALLTQSESAKLVNDANELEQRLRKMLSDEDFYKKCCEDCKNVFEQNQGALDRVIDVLKSEL
ncbi:3-deoxy-D-manno-octulosonic acid transferase [bacterium]|nr:3-deoxy-D-manno-octulosonic acid transferase [bacterium]